MYLNIHLILTKLNSSHLVWIYSCIYVRTPSTDLLVDISSLKLLTTFYWITFSDDGGDVINTFSFKSTAALSLCILVLKFALYFVFIMKTFSRKVRLDFELFIGMKSMCCYLKTTGKGKHYACKERLVCVSEVSWRGRKSSFFLQVEIRVDVNPYIYYCYKLVIVHMIKARMEYLDWSLLGPWHLLAIPAIGMAPLITEGLLAKLMRNINRQ